MMVQGQRLVLSQNIDVAKIGIDAIGKRQIDDAVNAAEGYRRLGAVPR
jgi:hypothetical protein